MMAGGDLRSHYPALILARSVCACVCDRSQTRVCGFVVGVSLTDAAGLSVNLWPDLWENSRASCV